MAKKNAQALDEHDGKTVEQFVGKSDCAVDGGAAVRAVSDEVGSDAQTRHQRHRCTGTYKKQKNNLIIGRK
jgi:hypothetical protein